MSAPIESKVYGSTVGTGAGSIVALLCLWALGVTFWGTSTDASAAADAIAAVPWPVAGAVSLVAVPGGAFLGGWLAKHTPRDDPDALPDDVGGSTGPHIHRDDPEPGASARSHMLIDDRQTGTTK